MRPEAGRWRCCVQACLTVCWGRYGFRAAHMMRVEPLVPDDRSPESGDWRPAHNYLSEAFLTLALYYLGLGVSGFIANIYFLRRARQEASSGIPVRHVGCLYALLAVHIVLAVVLGMALLIAHLRGGA